MTRRRTQVTSERARVSMGLPCHHRYRPRLWRDQRMSRKGENASRRRRQRRRQRLSSWRRLPRLSYSRSAGRAEVASFASLPPCLLLLLLLFFLAINSRQRRFTIGSLLRAAFSPEPPLFPLPLSTNDTAAAALHRWQSQNVFVSLKCERRLWRTAAADPLHPRLVSTSLITATERTSLLHCSFLTEDHMYLASPPPGFRSGGHCRQVRACLF